MKINTKYGELQEVNGQWVKSEPTICTRPSDYWLSHKTCRECGLGPTKEGHDGCLGALPNLMNACCGHEKDDYYEPYVQFWDGSCLRGKEALRMIEVLKQER